MTVEIVAPPSADPAERFRRRVFLAATIAAGTIGFLFAYLIWRSEMGVPFELQPGRGTITLHEDAGSPVRPWAPWWVVPSISALLAMVLWRALAVRRGRASFLGSMAAIVLVSIAVFPIAVCATQFGAIAQYVPQPPLWKTLAILPLMVAESVGVTAIVLMINGFLLLPLAALVGAVLAGLVRCVLAIRKMMVSARVSR